MSDTRDWPTFLLVMNCEVEDIYSSNLSMQTNGLFVRNVQFSWNTQLQHPSLFERNVNEIAEICSPGDVALNLMVVQWLGSIWTWGADMPTIQLLQECHNVLFLVSSINYQSVFGFWAHVIGQAWRHTWVLLVKPDNSSQSSWPFESKNTIEKGLACE